jgi:hypothetical protein
MDLNPYISSLRESLTTAAAAGDEQTRNAARVLAAAVEPAARLAIMNALADLAAEVTVALEDRVVDVRLNGQDIRVVVSGATAEEPEPEPPPMFTGDQGDISRITVRLFEELKGKAEEAAQAQGVSMNSFVQQAVQGALQNAARQHQWGGWGGSPWGGGGGDQWGGPWGRGDRGRGRNRDKGGNDQQGKGGRDGGSSRVRGWVEG